MASLFSIRGEQRYEVVRKVFEGGMGIVYEAEQHGARNFVKRVAIKVIRQNFATQKEFIENFIGEAKLVADLIHTNIVQTYHLGQVGGQYFMVMEFVRGVNLEQFIEQHRKQGKTVPLDIAAFITSRVAASSAAAVSPAGTLTTNGPDTVSGVVASVVSVFIVVATRSPRPVPVASMMRIRLKSADAPPRDDR